MKTETVFTKEGMQYTTKDGKVVQSHTFEIGDEFIPQLNKVFESSKEVTMMKKGKEVQKTITEYKLCAKVRNGSEILKDANDEEVLFVLLTPTQAKSIKKKIESGIEINQHIFSCYEYVNDFGPQVGVGIKTEFKPAIEFD